MTETTVSRLSCLFDQSRLQRSRRLAMPILTSPGIALIGRTANEVFRSGKLQFQAIRALADRFPMAAVQTMMDLSVEAEAFGAPVKYGPGENPSVLAGIVKDRDVIDRLEIPVVGSARTCQCLLAAELCAQGITDRPTLGGLIGPFSLAGRLLDMSRMMLLAVTEPRTLHALLEKTTAFLLEYARAFKATGCDGLLMAEPAAGLVSPAMAREFSYDFIRGIVDDVVDDTFVLVLHNCGRTEKMVDGMLSTGASALHVGNAVDITEILRQTPTTIPVMGNLDPTGVFLMSPPEEVFERTLELLETTRDAPNFILSSGCDIPPETPMENLEAFFEALEQFKP